MCREVDATARCLGDGELENETTSQEESIFIMEVMDRVREIGDLRYYRKRVEFINYYWQAVIPINSFGGSTAVLIGPLHMGITALP